jgi:hypothetical protein
MLISTSKDVLFIVLAFCALWLTVFLSWFLFYLIAILRDTEHLVRQVKTAVEKVDHLAHVVHDKVEHSAASFTLMAQAAKEVVLWMIQERRQTGTKGKKK